MFRNTLTSRPSKTRSLLAASAIVAALAALAAAGCGSSSTSSTPPPAPAPVTAPVVQTAQEAGTGYYNMSTLETALKSDKMTGPDGSPAPATARAKTARCVLSGPAAQCSVIMGDGGRGVLTVSINKDGQSFLITAATPGG
jgi:hypothetical protein